MISMDPAEFDRHWAHLYAWRNDPETRAASHESERVSLESHLRWLREAVGRDDVRLYVARDPETGCHVGTCRLDYDAKARTATLSVTVAPEHRRRGYGRQLIAKATELARYAFVDVAAVRAEVKEANEASLKAFAACGYVVAKVRKGRGDDRVVELVHGGR